VRPVPRHRTAEEEAIAQDLLQLSRSLPPLRPKAIPVSVVVPLLTPPDTPNQTLTITTLTTLAPMDTTPTPLTPSTSEYSSDAENQCPSKSWIVPN
jgi:hypothetical protein